MNLIEEAACNSSIVELGFNPINSNYIIKLTTVEPRQYFTHGCIKNQQSKAVISLFLSYIYIVLQIKRKCCNTNFTEKKNSNNILYLGLRVKTL